MASPQVLLAEAIFSFNVLFGSAGRAIPVQKEKRISDKLRSDLNSDRGTEVDFSENFDGCGDTCIEKIGQCLSAMHDAYHTELKRSTMLQEFLINELNHTEELEASLRNVKEELSKAVKQRENLKKKNESQLAELQMIASTKSNVVTAPSQSSDALAASSGDPQAMLLDMRLLGKFIGKNFPGYGMFYAIVATYQKPYYKLVYEDGDCEDMTPGEVKRLLRDEATIPRDIVEAIIQKSEEFDFDNPAECFTGLIDVAPGWEEGDKKNQEDDLKKENTVDSVDNGHTEVANGLYDYSKDLGRTSPRREVSKQPDDTSSDPGSNKKLNGKNGVTSKSKSNGHGDSGIIVSSGSDIVNGADTNSTAQDAKASQTPIYNTNLGDKYVPCPHCSKMYHRKGIEKHIAMKCSKKVPAVAAVGAATTVAAGIASISTLAGTRGGGALLSPQKSGSTNGSPISVSSDSSSSDGSGSSDTKSLNDSGSITNLSSTPSRPAIFSPKKRKHSPGIHSSPYSSSPKRSASTTTASKL